MRNLSSVNLSVRTLTKIALVIALMFAALYFRTYVLQGLSASEKKGMHERARETILGVMRDQVRPVIDRQFAGQDEVSKKKLTDRQVNELIASQRGQFENAVAEMEKRLLESRKIQYSSRYLPEADPYYYLRLTQNVLQTGKLGEAGKDGRYWDPLRFLPSGSWNDITLHPYLGAWLYETLRVVHPHLSLMNGVSFLPLILTLVIVLAFLWMGRYLGLSFLPVYLGCMVLVLSPMVIQRTVFGWYDTDAYNVLFPTLILATCFAAIRSRSRTAAWGILGGFLTAAFSLFWAGWNFIFLLVLTVSGLLSGWEFLVSKAPRKMWRYAAAYFFSVITFSLWFITPVGLARSLSESFLFVFKASGSSPSLWPNFFIMIGETNAVALPKWVYMVSNYLTVLAAVFGLLAEGRKVCLEKRDLPRLMTWMASCLIGGALFILSLKAERYVLLVVLPFSIFVAFGVSHLRDFFYRKFSVLPGKLHSEPYRSCLVLTLLYFLLVPWTLRGADVAGRISHIIMNDTWFDSLTYLRENTPKDAVIFSWWSPGHFITALGERHVALDGGAQQLKENYWVSKALMSDDEKEALGIFRMLAAGGNQAFEFLEREKWETPAAIQLILDAVKLDRNKMRMLLPQNWPDHKKNEFLNLVYGQGAMPPAYLFLYDDLVANNVILQLTARWNFGKAAQIAKNKKSPGIFSIFLGQGQTGYINDLMEIAGQPTPYQIASIIVQKRGEQLLFENGLVVDEGQQKAFLSRPAQDGQGAVFGPLNFIYKDSNQRWIFKENPEASAKAAAVLIPLQGGPMGVVSHIDLIKTLLFQLYFMDGSGLTCFTPKYSQYSPVSKTWIRIYQINWEPAT